MGFLNGNYQNGFFKSTKRLALIVSTLKGKNTDSVLVVQGTPGSLAVAGGADGCELTQGVLKVSFARLAGQQFLTADASNLPGDWGGASDMATRLEGYNYALSGSGRGGLQTLRVYAYNAPGGSLSNLLGCEISVYDRGEYASDGYSADNVTTLIVSQRCRSVVKTRTNLLVVDDRSDGSHGLTTCLATAMIRLHSEGGASFGARASGIHFGSAGNGTGWTHAFSFQTAAGKEGFTALVNKTQGGNVDGYIKIFDVATNQTLYIPCYDQAPA